MNRCPTTPCPPGTRRRALGTTGLLALALALPALPGLAQTVVARSFPPKALRGKLVVQQPPVVALDGKSAQLSPGARIRGTNNMLMMSAALVGQELTVNYLREPHGLVHEVWILTAAEAKEKRPTAADLED